MNISMCKHAATILAASIIIMGGAVTVGACTASAAAPKNVTFSVGAKVVGSGSAPHEWRCTEVALQGRGEGNIGSARVEVSRCAPRILGGIVGSA